MTTPTEALATKHKIIVDMALGFTAMIRVFESDSKPKIAVLVSGALHAIEAATSRQEFEAAHSEFCRQFVSQIKTTGRVFKSGAKTPKVPASYGQAAKVLDVCAKVWFYYCALPSPAVADRIQPWLHVAIDTPILFDLKRRYKSDGIIAERIAGIDAPQYRDLQTLAGRHRADLCDVDVSAVQYDDLQWYALNKGNA